MEEVTSVSFIVGLQKWCEWEVYLPCSIKVSLNLGFQLLLLLSWKQIQVDDLVL
jgi:hypothetical protein